MRALQRLLPEQNGGRSASRIAEVCTQLMEMSPARLAAYRLEGKLRVKWRFSEQGVRE